MPWVDGEYISFSWKNMMKLEYTTHITVKDIRYSGLKNLTGLSQITGKLTAGQLEQITAIGIRDTEYMSFEGIEKFINLNTLACFNIQLHDLSEIAQAANIQYLSLKYSKYR
jgi:Leucine-rich repeat (LRR) protein